MKPLKKAEQKNTEIDREAYTEKEYEALKNIEGVASLEDCGIKNSPELRVFFDYVKDIKIVLNEFGRYCPVAVMKTGETIYIEL